MKKILLTFICSAVAVSAYAQDLDTTTVSDTFDSGSRGNALGSPSFFNSSAIDGSEFANITDTDGAVGSIDYINSFAGATSGETETPVVDVTTAFDNEDRSLTATTGPIAANTNDTVSPNNAIRVNDDGGHNEIYFGESDDATYYVEADVYCFDKSAEGLTAYEYYGIAFRAGRDNDPNYPNDGYEYDRGGCYMIGYDAQTGNVDARTWDVNAASPDFAGRTAGFTSHASTAVTEGWHTLRVEGAGTRITFYVDGVELIEITDSTYSNGRPALAYRETGVASADETGGIFGRMEAGPTPPPMTVSDWSIYE